MMNSMTGYAFTEYQDQGLSLSVELKGYNSRFLEVFIGIPPLISSLEPELREYLSRRFRRGKIELVIRLREQDSPVSLRVNHQAARAYAGAIAELADSLGLAERPGLALILGMEGVLEIEKTRDDERYRRLIMPVLESAAGTFAAERSREGKHTEEDILSHISRFETALERIASLAPALEDTIKENLRSRFAELLGDRIDENRILAETAVLLMKYTVSEEISRLGAHLAEFRAEAARNPGPGKKLDFLAQEMNREVNTIGSKTPNQEVSSAVVEMKELLENIREQLRNIE
jgi:uncharacterized protein (TIGR00255 family)